MGVNYLRSKKFACTVSGASKFLISGNKYVSLTRGAERVSTFPMRDLFLDFRGTKKAQSVLLALAASQVNSNSK